MSDVLDKVLIILLIILLLIVLSLPVIIIVIFNYRGNYECITYDNETVYCDKVWLDYGIYYGEDTENKTVYKINEYHIIESEETK